MDSTNKVVCRTCLSLNDKNDTVLIYTILDLVMSCSSINISENDNLPSHICNVCHEKARNAYNFRILCEQSDVTLRTQIKLYDPSSKCEEKTENQLNDTLPQMTLENTDDVEDADYIEIKVENNSDFEMETGAILDDMPKDKLENVDLDSTNHLIIKVKDFEMKPFICKFCNKSFLYQRSFEKHQREHSTEDITCNKCGKIYSTFRQLTLHMNMHNRKGLHLCQTCGKQFTMPENLVKHIRIHTGEKRHKCNICNKAFTQSNELKSHMVTHSVEKSFLCNFCGNKFSRKVSLKVHMINVHSNSVELSCCNICGKGFKEKRSLSRHKKIHSDERSHLCNICNKAFNRRSTLIVHERIHNGQRPHVCSVCKKGFIQKHVLITHMQKIHPTE